jgi:hypothetical protein
MLNASQHHLDVHASFFD